MPIDHYETLGVDPRSEYETIRQAWVAGARTHHPDAMVGASEDEVRRAEIRMHEINEAWRVLGSEELRKVYDKERNQKNKIADIEQERWEEQWPEDELDLDDLEHRGFEVRSPVVALILRSIPWLLIAATGITIFVFSAFATGSAPRQMPAQECLAQSENGEITRPFDCEEPGALEIVSESGLVAIHHCDYEGKYPKAHLIADPQEANKYYCVQPIGD